jgi:5-methyltetrahydropteroyltriglutamate--homocysteine methyltransferase
LTISTDVGSLPPRVDYSKLREGARKTYTVERFLPRRSAEDPLSVFEGEVVGAFVDKLRAGVTVPNYPQFRDMNEMFLEMLQGVERTEKGYTAIHGPHARPGSTIPEADILRQNLSPIRDAAGAERIHAKACVTGPYTLSSLFTNRGPDLLRSLGEAVAEITARSVFNLREGEIALLSIDEPVLGFLDDPLIDHSSEGRGALRDAWERICVAASSRGAETMMHLHSTSEQLFWDVEHLDIIEPHVDDPLYGQEATRRLLEERDKRLKASISVTRFDDLIGAGTRGVEDIGKAWVDIRKGRTDPAHFLEDTRTMEKRLGKIVASFGAERVPYAGPECGMGGFPSYGCALEYLRRNAEAVSRHT